MPTVDGDRRVQTRSLMRDGRVVACWVLVSRLTGFARVAFLAAVLGPTFLGNLFQTAALLPSILFALLGGPLLVSILVPRLVSAAGAKEGAECRRLGGGFLGLALAGLGAVAALGVAGAGAILWVTTAAVDDPAVQARQMEIGRLLLAVMLPQLPLLGLTAVATAVQHAHGRFALPAAGQAIENLAAILALAGYLLLFGTGAELGAGAQGQVVLLGLCMTVAVATQSAVQWYGAWRCGVPLRPARFWRVPEAREVVSVIASSSRYSGLQHLTILAALVVAGSVPGGVVAMHIALQLTSLAVALGAIPLASVQLPRLARLEGIGDRAGFHATYRASQSMALFLAFPATAMMLAVPGVLAGATAFGEMAKGPGIALISITVLSLGLAVVGEAVMSVATSASYARRDTRVPVRAMLVRTAVALVGMAAALTAFEGVETLWALGLSLSLGSLCGAAVNHRGLVAGLPPLSDGLAMRLGVSAGAAAVAGAVAALGSVALLDAGAGQFGRLGLALLLVTLAGLTYLAVQLLAGSEELRSLLPRRPRAAAPPQS